SKMLMKIRYCFITLLLCSLAGFADAQVSRENLITDIQTLSSIAFAGRKPGTDGHEKAKDYIIERFTKLGLQPFEPDYTHAFPLNENLTGHNIIGYIPGK